MIVIGGDNFIIYTASCTRKDLNIVPWWVSIGIVNGPPDWVRRLIQVLIVIGDDTVLTGACPNVQLDFPR
ncbi:hypothetical protein ACCAA_470006 [Candidatus Accumulibacter aalborgensis]|uniref:Uncharacterized protein n=1 Tax=Candidatus Accumulibacter aalborgensis TaxID=1860102 RepID=A0A1A8XSC4_9PROT|nr:hypothetical protein ACCAA_470006 [Candidatus Accumulibacter aalborgensis]